nr:GNAT family N-acetyltransferase [Candidatus Sigynarchaeota archaeon]
MTRGTKFTLDDMRELARQRKGECLSDAYVNSRAPLQWSCQRGHAWLAIPNNIIHGTWCPVCCGRHRKNPAKGRKRYSILDMQALARARGGDCLSREYIGQATKLEWVCDKGHAWHAMPLTVMRGTWCPTCAIDKLKGRSAAQYRKKTITDARKLAWARGGKCLSKTLGDAREKLRWACKVGHEWETSLQSVLKGTWCPDCARSSSRQKMSHTIELMRQVAAKHGGKCLSSWYAGTRTKLAWKCSLGHEWTATPASILAGSWCPSCSRFDHMVGSKALMRTLAGISGQPGFKNVIRLQTGYPAIGRPTITVLARQLDARDPTVVRHLADDLYSLFTENELDPAKIQPGLFRLYGSGEAGAALVVNSVFGTGFSKPAVVGIFSVEEKWFGWIAVSLHQVNKRTAAMIDIVLDPALRRRGIITRLWNYCEMILPALFGRTRIDFMLPGSHTPRSIAAMLASLPATRSIVKKRRINK